MTTEYPKFDPQNPEAFEPLSYREVNELRNTDSGTHDMYGAEKRKWDEWRAEEERKKMQLPNPDFEASHAHTGRYKEIDLLTELGVALEREGFTVTYMSGSYRGDFKVHPSWAVAVHIYKDGQRVGSYRAWRPTTAYSYRPIGWRIQTNRGKGSSPSSWNNKEKRLKKLDSAVKFIKETAIPKLDYEDEIKRIKKKIMTHQEEARSLERSANKMEGPNVGFGDTILQDLLDMCRDNDMNGVWERLAGRNETIDSLRDQAKQWRNAAEKIQREQLNPLMERARKELPEFYS